MPDAPQGARGQLGSHAGVEPRESIAYARNDLPRRRTPGGSHQAVFAEGLGRRSGVDWTGGPTGDASFLPCPRRRGHTEPARVLEGRLESELHAAREAFPAKGRPVYGAPVRNSTNSKIPPIERRSRDTRQPHTPPRAGTRRLAQTHPCIALNGREFSSRTSARCPAASSRTSHMRPGLLADSAAAPVVEGSIPGSVRVEHRCNGLRDRAAETRSKVCFRSRHKTGLMLQFVLNR